MVKSNSGRKAFAATATVALAASAVAPVVTLAASNFDDVKEGQYYAEAINYLASNGHINGYGDGTFLPENEIKRSEAATVLQSVLGLIPSGTEDFSDVEVNDWFYDAVRATSNEIFEGYNGEFNPEDNLTRQEAAKIIVESYNLTGSSETSFEDIDGVWGESYIEVAYNNGIIKGENSTTFNPNGNVERGDFATMVYRAIQATAPTSVASVSAINAKQVEVKFNKSMDAESLFTNVDNGVVNEEVVVIDGVGDTADVTFAGKLSQDGKTLTLTADGVFDGKYSVNIVGAEDVDGNEVESYAGFFTADDVTRPTVSGVSYTSVNTAKISFSEPIADWGTITLNGTQIALADEDKGENFVLVDIDSLNYEEEGTVTFVGVRDHADNLVSPNPVKVDVQRPAEDVTDPKVESVSVVSDSRVKVVFSEELASATFEVNDTVITSTVEDDKVTYYLDVALEDGANKVEVTSFTDISDNAGDAVVRQFIVTVDEESPEVTSSNVLVNADGEEYLQLSFSESVVLGSTGPQIFEGTLEVDYVTDETAQFTATPVVDGDDNTKVNIPLQTAAQGNWTVGLAEGFVTDIAQNNNQLQADKVSFVRGEDEETTAPTELTVSSDVVDNVITLTFDGKLSGATAVNEGNYNIEGATVKSATLTSNTNTDGKAVVELALESGSVVATGEYELVIDGVKANDGTLVDVNPLPLTLNENVAPKFTSATIVNGNDVNLTFSESVNSVDATDFELLLDGEKFAGIYTVSTGTDKFVLSIVDTDSETAGEQGLSSEQLAKKITLELTDSSNIVDVKGNDLTDFGSFTVVKNIK
ncbi:S-layer homology domain-containing protein [Virgibacillus sp. DJP39]|uniref:S-layer homology domain-containing protein n=1 Tax=Virgibacillus sp. DJP39 TaxID=3409790 RepID=UPI003BB804FC